MYTFLRAEVEGGNQHGNGCAHIKVQKVGFFLETDRKSVV